MLRAMRRVAVPFVLALLGATPAAAQERFRVPLPEARRTQHAEERVRAWVLFSEGAASTAAGTAMALATDDDRTRFAGLLTLGFGAVNVALALPWVLRVCRGAASPRPGETELAARLRHAREGQRSAAVFALNLGLDVAYITAGAFAWALADRDERLRGGGIAGTAQGVFLLVFDLWGWIAADGNAARYTALAE